MNISAIAIGQLACLASMIEMQDIQFVSFPDELFKSASVQDPALGNTSISAADFKTLKTYVQKFEEGIWTDP